MEQFRALLVDAAPGPLLGRELERLLGHGLAVTLNLRRVTDRAALRAEWGDRVEFTDFDPFDEEALLAGAVRDGLGHHAVKSRAGVPLRAAFLAGAAGPVRARTTSTWRPPPATESRSPTPPAPTRTRWRSSPWPNCSR